LQPSSPRLFRVLTLISWGPVLVLFAAAFLPTLISFLRQRHSGWLIHLVIISVVLNALLFWGSSRFRYPIEALCLLLASVAVMEIARRIRHRRPSLVPATVEAA
jgi:hypothetical protein